MKKPAACHRPPEVEMAESMTESMTEDRFPEPDDPFLAPDGRDLRSENGHPSHLSGLRFLFVLFYHNTLIFNDLILITALSSVSAAC